MRGRTGALPSFVLAACVSLVACEKAPEADAAAARAALEEARSASGGRWAAASLDHAQALYDDASSELASQAGRYAFFRHYARAREILAAARADAVRAREAAEREREEARQEAAASLKRARTVLEGARAAIRIAPSPRDGKAELARLREELGAVEREIPAVQGLIDTGDFRQAALRAGDLAARVEVAVTRFLDGTSRRSAAGAGTCSGRREALSFRCTPQRREVRG